MANNTSLVGTVTDAGGAVVVGAKVVGVNSETKVEYNGTTNGEGYYSIPYVQPGTYQITVEAVGFQKMTFSGIIVQLNMAARTDAKLAIGSSNTEVTVAAENAVLSTDDAMLGETIDQKRVENLPQASRRVMELAAVASNVIVGPKTSYTGNPPGAAFIGAGTREVNNSLTLDGITIMNSLISTSPVTPNPDAIAAVQIQNGNYTAQYGGYMGVHINMDTKSGTNKFHGTVYDYIENDVLNAKPFFASKTARKAPLRFNQFGVVVDGPIWKDHAFFMGSYEGLRQNAQVQSTGSVLTSAMRNGDFSMCLTAGKCGAAAIQLRDPVTGVALQNNRVSNISSIAQKFLAYMPLPTDESSAVNNLNTYVPNSLYQNQTLDRLDYAVNNKIRLFVRYSWQKLSYTAGSVIPTSNTYGPTTNQNGIIGYTHILTPHLINDFRFGYNQLSTLFINYFQQNNIQGAGSALGIPGFTSDVSDNNPGIPSVNITSYTSLGTDGANWYQDDRTLHGYDQISWNKGQHNLMAGVELRKMAIGRAAQNAPRGVFTFTNTYTQYAAADFLTGYASTVATPVTQIKGSVAEWRDGFFLQDNWLVTPKLTLLYGVRYELPTVPYSLNGYSRIINRDYTGLTPDTSATTGNSYTPTPGLKLHGPNHDLVAPRLGFAYRVTDKIVLRGGGGIYYNPNHMNNFTLMTGNYPFANSVTYNGQTTVPGTLSFSDPTGGQSGSANCVPGTIGCYLYTYNINYYLPTPRLYQWNLDSGVELWRNAALEFQYLGSTGAFLDYSHYINQPTAGAGNVNARRPNQRFGVIRQFENGSRSSYHALNVSFKQTQFHGLDATLAYTWAHTMDMTTDSNGGGTPQNQYNLKADWGNANWDIRHRFVGTLLYTLPKLTGMNPVARYALGGWQANAIVTLQTGIPINIGLSSDFANDGNLGTHRPNYVKATRSTCSRQNVIAGAPCLDSTAYSNPTLYTYGNLHKNDIHGPGYANTNLSVFKNFPIKEGITFQFRAESFNIFNHANPANPNSTFGSGTFGLVTSVQNNSQNGGGSRLMQFAGKINF